MDSGGNTILDKSVGDISQNGTIAAQWDGTTLYWGMQAANAAYGAAWSVRHFLIPAALPANGAYYWRVCAYDATGQYSLWSAYRTFRTAMLPPALLIPANTGLVLTTRPAFDWASVAGASSYTLQVSTSQAFSNLVINTSPKVSIYTPGSDLPGNQVLYWRVKANGTNPSAWSLIFSFTSADPPAAPKLATPADSALLSDYTPTLDWNDVPATAYYEIQIAASSSFSDVSLVSYKQVSKDTSSFAPSDPLNTNATYYWRVQAKGAYSSDWSEVRYGAVIPQSGGFRNPLPTVGWVSEPTRPHHHNLHFGSLSGIRSS
jgi:hypothetical protein